MGFHLDKLNGFDLLGCHFHIIHPINSKMKISHLSIIERNYYYYICNHLENLIQTMTTLAGGFLVINYYDAGRKDFKK